MNEAELQNLRKWNEIFYHDKKATVQFEGKTYPITDCHLIGQGSFKFVYQPEGTGRCFIIPRHCSKNWNYTLTDEKKKLDEILRVGLRAQQFDLVPITVTNSKGDLYTVNAIATTSFKSLCEAESLIIYDHKASPNKITGNIDALNQLGIDFTDSDNLKKLLRSWYQDFVTGVTFKLPLASRKLVDDSEHYCLELPKNPGEFPQVRYMFWDVAADFSGILFPKLPLLDDLNQRKRPNITTYKLIAEAIACVLTDMKYPPNSSYNYIESIEYFKLIENSINMILEQDPAPFTDALQVSKNQVIAYYKETVFVEAMQLEGWIMNRSKLYLALAQGVISTQDKDLVDSLLSLNLEASKDLLNNLTSVIDTVKTDTDQQIIERLHQARTDILSNYLDNKDVINTVRQDKNEFIDVLNLAITTNKSELVTKVLKTPESIDPDTMELIKTSLYDSNKQINNEIKTLIKNHLQERLKAKFLSAYQDKLTTDKHKLCGLFSFFSKSYVQRDSSLEKLIQHAQGQSNKGSGHRSLSVMQDLGWLGKDKSHIGELQQSLWVLR